MASVAVAIDKTDISLIVPSEGACAALCDFLRAFGCSVTTVSMNIENFKGRRVAIFPANDVPGRRQAQAIAGQLVETAAAVKIVELPGLPAHGNIASWISEGGTTPELIQHIGKTPAWTLKSSEKTEIRRGTVGEAEEFLITLLSDGPKPSTEIQEAAASEGITLGTLRRGADRLGIKRRKTGGRFGGDPRWYWSLD